MMKPLLWGTVSLLSGLLIGYSARSLITEHREAPSKLEHQTQEYQTHSENRLAADLQKSARSRGEVLSLAPVSAPASLESLVAKLDINSKGPKPELDSAEKIIAYLRRAHAEQSQYYVGRERGLREQIRANPALAYELINQLDSVEEEKVRESIGQMLSFLNFIHKPFLEPAVLENLRGSTDPGVWLELLGSWGLQSKSSVAYLYSQLDSWQNSQHKAHAVSAISNSSWARKAAFSPQERQQIRNTFTPYFSADDPALRASAVNSLTYFPGEDLVPNLLRALEDPEKQVREAARHYLQSKGTSNQTVIDRLLTTIKDSERGLGERSATVDILLHISNISEAERAQATEVQKQINTEIAAMTEGERQAFYRGE